MCGWRQTGERQEINSQAAGVGVALPGASEFSTICLMTLLISLVRCLCGIERGGALLMAMRTSLTWRVAWLELNQFQIVWDGEKLGFQLFHASEVFHLGDG